MADWLSKIKNSSGDTSKSTLEKHKELPAIFGPFKKSAPAKIPKVIINFFKDNGPYIISDKSCVIVFYSDEKAGKQYIQDPGIQKNDLYVISNRNFLDRYFTVRHIISKKEISISIKEYVDLPKYHNEEFLTNLRYLKSKKLAAEIRKNLKVSTKKDSPKTKL